MRPHRFRSPVAAAMALLSLVAAAATIAADPAQAPILLTYPVEEVAI